MNAPSVLLERQRAARLRAVLIAASLAAPLVLALAAVGWRLGGAAGAVALAGVGIIAAGVGAVWNARRFDRDWLIAALDARLPRFEDSTALLFQPAGTASGLIALQRRRIEARVAEAAAVDLRPDWSWRRLALACGVGLVLTVAALVWPRPEAGTRAPPVATAGTGPVAAPALTEARVRIVPPAYTGLPAREQTGLDVRAPAGSTVEWRLAFDPAPEAAGLGFPEGDPLALSSADGVFMGRRVLTASTLYRVEAPGLPRQRLNRLDAIPDTPPEVTLVSPDSQLVLATAGQTRFAPVFEVSDDYGASAAATLRITVTKGDGENITASRTTRAVTGTGPATARRFALSLDLAAEGLEPGGDLIVQLVVTDNRSPGPQTVEGPSVILRWPKDLALADAMDGSVPNILPAYFRSQRQIIIDAEALIAERARIEEAAFRARSFDLGSDQAQLRVRYGQFAGDEAEVGGSTGGIALPTNDAPALPTNDGPAAAPTFERPEHHEGDGHDHSAETGTPIFGSETNVLAEFGHDHGSEEAVSGGDPQSPLGRALNAMWSSERELRQARPEAALPFAYAALEFLKEAQQATRIFLSRTASRLPPLDLARRLTGKRDDIVADPAPLPARPAADAAAAAAWRALDGRPGAAPLEPSLTALDRWIGANRGRLADPLALSAAVDTVRNEPTCAACRRRLQAELWTALERPAAPIQRRPAADVRGRRYLDGLR